MKPTSCNIRWITGAALALDIAATAAVAQDTFNAPRANRFLLLHASRSAAPGKVDTFHAHQPAIRSGSLTSRTGAWNGESALAMIRRVTNCLL